MLRKREKNFSPDFRSDPTRARNSKKKAKKLKKTSFRRYIYPKRDVIGREKEKKNLVPNSVPTRPRQENSKKIKKIKNHHSSLISIQTGMR